MDRRSRATFLKAGVWTAAGLALVILTACGGIPLKVVGNEYRLTVKEEGNIADGEAKTSQDRVAVLAQTLTDRRSDLGGAGISKDELAFMPYAESVFILPNGETQVLTVLYQIYKGARVLDGLQYGSFDRKTGELRAVRAFLKNPAELPDPPTPDMAAWSRAHQVFREYLATHKATKINFQVEEQPVVSAALGTAGYLARYSRRNTDGSLSRFAAIVDPAKKTVQVLYDMSTD